MQPLQLGHSLSVSVFGTKKPDFPSALEANSLFTQRSSVKTDPVFTSSHPSPFLRASLYTCIDSRATALVLATLLKGTLQALGLIISLEAWEDLCAGILVPDHPPLPVLEKGSKVVVTIQCSQNPFLTVVSP